jgi:N-acetylglucosaminyl-diphospho-decaprenol L-rhamnosyltransferase
MRDQAITLSIVSHGQNALVNLLLDDLQRHCRSPLQLILTQNVPEPVPVAAAAAERILNEAPKGFGANHNAAFRRCKTEVFCVLNPDIRLAGDPFPALRAALSGPRVAAAGPLVLDAEGKPEDSARRFPTVMSLARKFFAGKPGPEYPHDQGARPVDWIAGMCIAFRSDAFAKVGGFDERFFLYYEDVDLCRRLQAAGYAVVYEPRASVIHHARRTSRRNARYMAIHAASALRYLLRN